MVVITLWVIKLALLWQCHIHSLIIIDVAVSVAVAIAVILILVLQYSMYEQLQLNFLIPFCIIWVGKEKKGRCSTYLCVTKYRKINILVADDFSSGGCDKFTLLSRIKTQLMLP